MPDVWTVPVGLVLTYEAVEETEKSVETWETNEILLSLGNVSGTCSPAYCTRSKKKSVEVWETDELVTLVPSDGEVIADVVETSPRL